MVNGAVIVKVRAFEVPPPGLGLLTVMLAVPAVRMSLAGIEAVNWVALTKVVVRSNPFHRTVEAETKLVPVTVRVKPGNPASAELGLSPEIAGAGLLIVRVRSLVA